MKQAKRKRWSTKGEYTLEDYGLKTAHRLFIAPSRTRQLLLDKTTSIDMI